MKKLAPVLDVLLTPFAALGMAAAVPLSRWHARLPLVTRVFDAAGVYPIRHHYYSPLVRASDLRYPLERERGHLSIDLNATAQLKLLAELRYQDELLQIPLVAQASTEYGYNHPNFGPGDAEFLYSLIRYVKPRRILEIGSGGSTMVASLAIAANQQHDPTYACEQRCVEPYEQPWLERLGVTVFRSRIEDLPATIVDDLEENDILFIDSSHVVRPQGDVIHEYLTLIPRLRAGVIVHAHDIFTPRDYPAAWVLRERWLWAEQYLLEAFLSYNEKFEIIAALNWLWHNHPGELGAACPVLATRPEAEPGSFWFRRKCP